MEVEVHIQKMKEMMDAAQSNQIASDYTIRQYTDRNFLVKDHVECAERMKHMKAQYIVQHTVTPTLHSSFPVALIPMNCIPLSQLDRHINKPVKGKFILCRTIVPPFKMNALGTVVEDPSGTIATRLSIYNFIKVVKKEALSMEELNDLLPVGTVLAIKNPWFKTTADNGLSLRCDNPEEVVRISDELLAELHPSGKWSNSILEKYHTFIKKKPVEPKIPPAELWRQQGNEFFVKKEYHEAAKSYTKALPFSPDNVDVLTNRAAAYLNIEMYELSLADASAALLLDPTHVKAIFRKTKSLWGLKKYKEALIFLTHQSTVKNFPPKSAKLLQSWTSTTKTFLTQSVEGKYPMKEIATLDATMLPLDLGPGGLGWAEYEGHIEIKDTEDEKGRGVFSTEPLEPGQLIFASKAFAYVSFAESNSKARETLFSINTENKLMKDFVSSELINAVVHKLRANPEKGREFYQLYAGPELRSLNELPREDSVVDIRRIDAICTYNTFGYGSGFDLSEKVRFGGIWLKPSFINHSCYDCNAHWMTHGDFIFIRAFKYIHPGEEITISYCPIQSFYSERKEICNKFGFDCYCSLCVLDRAEPEFVHKKRKELMEEAESLPKMKIPGSQGTVEILQLESLETLEAIVTKIEKLTLGRPLQYYPFLHHVLHAGASSYFGHGNFMKSYEFLEKNWNILKKSPLQKELCGISVNAMGSLLQAKQIGKARKWVKVMEEVALKAYGTQSALGAYANTLRMMLQAGIMDFSSVLLEDLEI